MKKFMSLLKAMLSQDMDLFKYKAGPNSSVTNRIMLPIVATVAIMFAVGIYYQILAEQLSAINLTYITLSIAMLVVTIIALIEGIYKSQGILFESKDNNLLFAMPINKKTILLARLTKMYLFQLLFNSLFIIPAFVVYLMYEQTNVQFVITSLLMIILIPIIPTIIGCFIGCVIKGVSSKHKSKKVLQTFLTFGFLIAFMCVIYTMQNWIPNLVNNANSIDEMISKIYYPIGAYIKLINEFDIKTLMLLLLVNIVPLILFVLIMSKNYFKIITKSNENDEGIIKRKGQISFKQRGITTALVIKELKKYFSSSVYFFNTFFGMVLLFIATIAMSINFKGIVEVVSQNKMPVEMVDSLINFVPVIYFGLIIIISCLSSITSSSISIEGKTFNISKSLPIKNEKILLSKILASDVICIPVILICDMIFFIAFSVTWFEVLSILLISIIAPTFIAIIGLLLNLKYPKMNATSDTEIVKQSMSSGIAVFLGMGISGILILLLIFTQSGAINIDINYMIFAEIIFLLILTIILWNVLKRYGKIRYEKIEV